MADTTVEVKDDKPVGIVIDKVSAIRSGILFGSGFFAAAGFSSLSTEFGCRASSAIVTFIRQYARQPSQLLSCLSAFEQVYRIFDQGVGGGNCGERQGSPCNITRQFDSTTAPVSRNANRVSHTSSTLIL